MKFDKEYWINNEEETYLNDLYWIANKELFGNTLPGAEIVVLKSEEKRSNSESETRTEEINLRDNNPNSFSARGQIEITWKSNEIENYEILVHGMIHQWQSLYGTEGKTNKHHNYEYRIKSDAIGLRSTDIELNPLQSLKDRKGEPTAFTKSWGKCPQRIMNRTNKGAPRRRDPEKRSGGRIPPPQI